MGHGVGGGAPAGRPDDGRGLRVVGLSLWLVACSRAYARVATTTGRMSYVLLMREKLQHVAAQDPDYIEIVGAREHNLKVDRLEVPKRELVVFTGVSGSGKSSLAFDTIYAEGQRRYVETLSAYARQFLGQLERPRVEHLRGLSPTIAIEQKSASANPRSTVGTITEVHDYLRVLYARLGVQHCTNCGKPVVSQTAEQIADEIVDRWADASVLLLAPLVVHRKGEFRDLLTTSRESGFTRVMVDGKICHLDKPPTLAKNVKHTILLVIDRLTVKPGERGRLVESIELGLTKGAGTLRAQPDESGAEGQVEFSQSRTCCGRSYPELSPQSFSFNSPLGMCQACNGLGTCLKIDPDLVVPNPDLTIREGAVAPWASAMARGDGWGFRIANAAAKACNVSLDVPWKKLGARSQEAMLHGLSDRRISVRWGKEGSGSHGTFAVRFEGVIPTLMRRYQQTSSEAARQHYRSFMTEQPCEACGQKRLRQESLQVRLWKRSIADVSGMTVAEASRHFLAAELAASERRIAEGALREVQGRLSFLLDVGLDYLTLERSGPTLSGGEAQRIRLASQLGSELSGVIYVLDEPSIGLHQKDNQRLIETLKRLRDLGNTVIVVEHDEETIRSADHVVDFGVGAGERGGRVVFTGTPEALPECPSSITGAYLAGRRRIASGGTAGRRAAKGELWVRGASEHNLKNLDVCFPLGCFVAVTGVSGAGKSSLVNGILRPALARHLHRSTEPIGKHRRIDGLAQLDKAISIDQQPIGRTPRSNPGTYTKAFDEIREIFAQLPEARARGFQAGRFSFNLAGGRCEACHGDGVVKVEMHFLADVYVPCEACQGKRYNAQTLTVQYKGLNVAQVLDLSVDDAFERFRRHGTLARILDTLRNVGLGYMKIGQPAPTLSGGEAQRVKLSRELGKSQTGRTLYILDEPTTGLHFEDIQKLLSVLAQLVDAGNSVIVIEHNLDVIRCADWVIDMGPAGGEAGGRIVAAGTPEDVARSPVSHTGRFLATALLRDAPTSVSAS